jgi:hypothetical protein
MAMVYMGARWFCAGHGNVGIVKVTNVDNGEESIRYYIGQCDGNDESDDVRRIMDFGSSFPRNAGDVLFSNN